jgi:hypothetical protein
MQDVFVNPTQLITINLNRLDAVPQRPTPPTFHVQPTGAQAAHRVQAMHIMQTAWPQILKSVCHLKQTQAISASMAGRLILSLHTRLTQRMQSLLTSAKADSATVHTYLASYAAAQQLLGGHLHVEERRIAQTVLALMRDEDEVCNPCAQGLQASPTELANQALEMAGFSSRIRHNPQDGARVMNKPRPRDFTSLRMPIAVEAILF